MTVPANTTTQGTSVDSDGDDASSAPRPAPPSAVRDAMTLGEGIYQWARGEQWTHALRDCATLESRAADLRWEIPGRPLGEDQLLEAVSSLRETLQKHERLASMVAANRISFIAIGLSVPYATSEPLDYDRFRYQVRALEIALSEHAPDVDELRAVSQQIAATWSTLRSQADARSARTLLVRIDKAIAALRHATTPLQFQMLADRDRLAAAPLEDLFVRE